ncbi:MAG: pyridoxal-phosphate dependent enzyme [Bacteroidetes bacterium]|nr:pyridoxal-phosphate dependent enzyme [Bacteroidota bacterium]
MLFKNLYPIISKKVSNANKAGIIRTKDIHSVLVKDLQIRDIFELDTPKIDDLSEILELKKGKVLAVRMDSAYGITGFKKPVVASLILKRTIEAAKHGVINNCWIDGGNVNSALALAYYAKKFEGKAAYVISRLFPDYFINYVNDTSNYLLEFIKAPNLKLGIERDFYKYLLDLVRKDPKFRNYQPLWHAKYSGEYTQFIGLEISEKMKERPDYIVAVIGAGTTIEGQAIPIKKKFHNVPKIVVPEHSKCPLLSKKKSVEDFNDDKKEATTFNCDWFENPPKDLPHMVLGPHYDEINPLLKESVFNEIDHVFKYNEEDWEQMSFKCYNNGLRIGNSSAANLAVAKYLAERGKTVLTFIYEPFRTIYQGKNFSK